MEKLSLLMSKMCLCDSAEDAEPEVSQLKRKNLEAEKEQIDIEQPLRKRIRITQDHGKEPCSRPHDMQAPVKPPFTISSLIEEPRTPSQNEGPLDRSPCGADYSCDPGVVECVPGSDNGNEASTALKPPTLPTPGTGEPNQRQGGGQAFPYKISYILNSSPDMWSRGQPSAVSGSLDTVYYSDDESEYGEELSSSEIGREGSVTLTDTVPIQTRNEIPKAYMDEQSARKGNEEYDDSEDQVEPGMRQPPRKRARIFKSYDKGWLSEAEVEK